MAKWSQSSDLEVQGSSLAHCLCFLRQETLLHFISLYTSVQVGTDNILGGGVGGNPVMDYHLILARHASC